MEERNFNEVLESIKALVKPENVKPENVETENEQTDHPLYTKLKSAPHWGKNQQWKRLQWYVRKYVTRSSSDATAIKIYAILYGHSEKQVEEQFKREGC